MAVQTQILHRRDTAANWTSTNPTLGSAEIGVETDTNKFKIGNGSSSWTALSYQGGSATFQMWRKAASGGETSLSGSDDFSTTLAYTVGAEQVFINGVLLERGVDYTASTGTSITGLTALVASDVATVVSTSTLAIANAIPLSTVTAKGDLLAATGASTVTNLPVGADGTTLVANSSAATGMSWTGNQAAGKNGVINGGMDIWQRGTSVALAASTSAANGYTADRWDILNNANQAMTISRQATGDTTNLPNIQYNARVQRNSGQTGTGTIYMRQGIETANSIPFIGKAVTFSFYARAGANYSAASNYLTFTVGTGTGTDQNPMSFTGEATPINNPTQAITTTWQRFTGTGTLSSSATEIYIGFAYTPTGTAGAADYFEVTGVQLELGAAPTTFTRAGGTLQGELAACQRYYWRATASSAYAYLASFAWAATTTVAVFTTANPVAMRVAPTAIDYTANINFRRTDGAVYAMTGITLDSCSTLIAVAYGTISGGTAANVGTIASNNSTSSYLGFSAEL